MNIYEKFVKYSVEFFVTKIDADNFNETVFPVLNKIISFKHAYVFFINQDMFNLKYGSDKSADDLTKSEFKRQYDNECTLFTDLCIEDYSFARLVIARNSSYNEEERLVFSAAASIISSIIKYMEISSILKMQVKALQNGMYELNKANDIIKKQNKKIRSSEKTKSEFFANVSHQLRSPLNSIIGYTDLLAAGHAGVMNKNQQSYLNDIKISGIKLLGMVNEILDISKLETDSMVLFKTGFNLMQNVQEVLNILYPLYKEKNISVTCSIPDDLEIYADYQKLQQAFFNLISNAIKFTPENGKIEVFSGVSSKKIEISVKDNGVGVAPENQKKIFKKFVQLNPRTVSSTGLGLTIADQIVRLHSGRITLKSGIGQGAEFKVVIPQN